ncbi:GDSL-type esterase/lipase family protein [Streptomyces buecherae]|uniref:GDSL-type esterase/lipase family protein n=1 Tax=Streptomyces buecherae TaxID=2763006 RepID=UPI001C25EEBE|nr:GDSL-type esterase/lipase family protein [Streptomyces buecherae]
MAASSLAPPSSWRSGIRPCTALVHLLVTALLAGLLSALTVLAGATPAQAVTVDRAVLSWNMQGAGEGGNDPARKWETLRTFLLKPDNGLPDVVLLQEGGPMDVPAAQHVGTIPPDIVNGANEPINRVEHYTWKISTGNPFHIYRAEWDVNGHRVNPTIVTREPADGLILVGRIAADTRPLLGVRFGNDVYFTLHAASPGGNDAMALVRRAQNWAWGHNPAYSVMVAGDFNREPKDLGNLNGMEQHNTGLPTHTSGKELDYALAGTSGQEDDTNAIRFDEPGRFSDHSPVLLTQGSCAALAATGAHGVQTAAPRCREAVVSMGDSYISGEAGRWQGNGFNGQYSYKAKQGSAYGTDRAAYNCTGSGTDEKCEHDPKRVYGETGEGKEQCHRSDVAPIKSLGEGLGIPEERRINIACSGATTDDVISKTFKGEKPQVEQLAKLSKLYRLKYVVLSIGGNDLGFSKIAQDCVIGYEFNSPCSTKGRDDVAGKLEGVRNKVATAVEAVQKTLRDAGQNDTKIILQGYPNPVPAAQNIRYENKMWMREMAGGCPLHDKDVDWLHYEVVPGLNQSVASVARAANVIYLDSQSAFAGHELCSKGASQAQEDSTPDNPPHESAAEWVRWIPSLLDWAPWTQGEKQEAVHPNAFGQQALGSCLRKTMQATPDRSTGYFTCAGMPNTRPGDVRLLDKKQPVSLPDGARQRLALRNASSGDLADADWGGKDAYVRGESAQGSDQQAWEVASHKPGGVTNDASGARQEVLADITVKRGATYLANSADDKWAQLADGGRNGLTRWAVSPPGENGAVQYFFLRERGGQREVAGCLTQNPLVMTAKDLKSWLTVERCDNSARQQWWFEEPGQAPPSGVAASNEWSADADHQLVNQSRGECVSGSASGAVSLAECEGASAEHQQWDSTAVAESKPSTVNAEAADADTSTGVRVATSVGQRSTPTASGAFYLVNAASQKCLRYEAAERRVAEAVCASAADQQWEWQGRTLRSVSTGTCLVPGSQNALGLTDCVTVPDAFQGGTAPRHGNRVTVRSATGLAMALPGGDTSAGAKIVGTAPDPAKADQAWRPYADTGPDGIWRLAPQLIDTRHLSYNVIDRVAALMDAVQNNKGEQWRWEPIGGGWYRIVNNLDNTVLTATNPGQPLALAPRSNDLGQWWRVDTAPGR